ncbi:Suppressor of the cold-sensitive snRNP biogenesis mutant brr1-1 [Mucor velutinosus]|uniref:Suppressor of the cold-sensitive snRNP biogenesis mutant brr1-1 n=1 Tax=Mucor velutinosus TaxID=708070 RepID=A0AAN7D6Q1_9FUNG|nr:Suppressor of the cold-sensitive snRNP biogenesis mutant brr1-1 [Mucor velutinosus]
MKYSSILLMIMAIFLVQANGQGALTKCQAERQQALNLHVIGNYIPQCQSNGSYSPRQCYGSTGYCVCVNTSTGEAISEPVGPTEDPGKLPC